MQISSQFFLFIFLPVILFLVIFINKKQLSLFLILISFIFYFFNAGGFILLLFILISVNYLLAILINRFRERIFGKIALLFGLMFNVGILLYYKYLNFFLDLIGSLPASSVNTFGPGGSILFPAGLSFIVFLAVSYLVDVFRDTAPVNKNLISIGLYFSLFPKLLMGPITLYGKFHGQLDPEARRPAISSGIKRFIIGLSKKILIADSLAMVSDAVFSIPADGLTFSVSWLGALSYTLQIYFDFSGYTDMAIGLGLIMGFSLPENFNYPYISASIKEFWKRWHMSLATWLQSYLFLPTAYFVLRRIKSNRWLGIKAENWAYFIGAFVTMFLCGLWHGANLTFVVWGIYYGILLILEHAFLGKWMKRHLGKLIRISITLLLVVAGWVIFRSPDLGFALHFFKAMAGMGAADTGLYSPALMLNGESVFFVFIAVAGSVPLKTVFASLRVKTGLSRRWEESRDGWMNRIGTIAEGLTLIGLFVLCLISISVQTYTPFVYAGF